MLLENINFCYGFLVVIAAGNGTDFRDLRTVNYKYVMIMSRFRGDYRPENCGNSPNFCPNLLLTRSISG